VSTATPRSRAGRWERLSVADLSNFVFERKGQVYTVAMAGVLDAGVLLGEDGEPDLATVRLLLAPRVQAVPRLCQRVHFTRWWQGLPVWVDCPVDLGQHVGPGPSLPDDAALAAVCGRLQSRPIPRDRPLWDLTLCPGPGARRVTMVLRLHHALADGVSGVRILRSLFDPDGTPAPAVTPRRPPPAPPSGWQLARDAWRTRVSRLATAITQAYRFPSRWRAAGLAARRTAVIARGGMPRSSLLGPVGTSRSVRLVGAELSGVRSLAHSVGCTVNDVLLGAVAEATTALLESRREPVPSALPVSVPVSLRGPEGGGGVEGNEVGVMRVLLPLAVSDPAERLRLIGRQARGAKEEARAAGTLEFTRSRLGTRVMDVFARHQHTIGLFVTNVPGPRQRLALGGCALREAWPLSALGGNVRIAVAALSYAGTLHVTVTVDADSCPDVDVFSHALASALSREPVRTADQVSPAS
jgi:WS/DGAT/MGAT family acyltransferase